MKKIRILVIALICLITIPVASVVYKSLLGFYGFKRAMCKLAVPRAMHTLQCDLPEPDHTFTNIKESILLQKWVPTAFTNQFGIAGIRLILPSGASAQVYTKRDRSCLRDWLDDSTPPALDVLSTAYSSWEKARMRYPTDLEFLNATIGRPMPSYLEKDSASVQHPIGRHILPLFPAPKNYRKEYALFAVKGMQSHTTLPFLQARGRSRFFFVLRGHKGSAEVLFGDQVTGMLDGSVILLGSDDQALTKDFIADICLCLDNEANQSVEATR